MIYNRTNAIIQFLLVAVVKIKIKAHFIRRKITPKISSKIVAEEFKKSKGGKNSGNKVPRAAPINNRPKENLSMLNMN